MNMNVLDKTERLELGGIIELRGCFTEVVREDGISYECVYYRTTDRTATFATLHAQAVREERDALIADVTWRYERYARETRLGMATTDDIGKLDAYIQALCNIPDQAGFPHNVVWPVL